MPTRKQTEVAAGFVLCLSISLVLLTLFDITSLESFFVLGLIELVLLRELIDPIEVRPPWQKKIDRILIFGLMIFVIVIGRRIASFLPPVMSV